MGRMAQIVAARMIRALLRLGWVRDRQKGSHVVLTKGGRCVTVPLHPVLKEGTARAILKQAGVAEDEFFAEY
jgi:predicted RNA binding protein YcfA (HicA-like mRNA interferase family)